MSIILCRAEFRSIEGAFIHREVTLCRNSQSLREGFSQTLNPVSAKIQASESRVPFVPELLASEL